MGNPVVVGNFHSREAELGALLRRARDGNHVLLSGQLRIGKTSIAKELERKFEHDGCAIVFADL